MIAVGAKLIAEFHWILYVFGGFLILTALKMLLMKTEHDRPEPEHRRAARRAGSSRSPPGSTASTSSCARARRASHEAEVPGRGRRCRPRSSTGPGRDACC